MLFSQRHGYTPVKDVIQREAMDEDLRTAIWNVFDTAVWSSLIEMDYQYGGSLYPLVSRIWTRYFKRTLDTVPRTGPDARRPLREHVFGAKWFAVYDLLELIVNDESIDRELLAELLNEAFEAELSAYRFVGGRVTEITAAEEIQEIEDALAATEGIAGAATHLRTALDYLADRQCPDYRNSIKESISAVETIANRVGETSGKSLGVALAKIDIGHPALEGAFSKLYGYTSDANGIRHALMSEPNLEFEDAKFMLVACSAFVNYLLAKAGRAGISV